MARRTVIEGEGAVRLAAQTPDSSPSLSFDRRCRRSFALTSLSFSTGTAFMQGVITAVPLKYGPCTLITASQSGTPSPRASLQIPLSAES